jgi:hypothetical protein
MKVKVHGWSGAGVATHNDERRIQLAIVDPALAAR